MAQLSPPAVLLGGAKEGTIAAACQKLTLARPTISAQIRALENALGEKLFRRSGRYLVLTETGRVAYRYADEIFSLGREMVHSLKGRPTGSPLRFRVGIADVLPKLVARQLLKPALSLAETVRLICHESTQLELLAKLGIHELDLILCGSPMDPGIQVRAYNHVLGECGVSIFGTNVLAPSYRRRFPESLDVAPFLLPMSGTVLRRSLDQWFDSVGIRPVVVGEFDDSALPKVFGQASAGLFAAPDMIENEVRRQCDVQVIGQAECVRERFCAISIERKMKHPAAIAIADAARERLSD